MTLNDLEKKIIVKFANDEKVSLGLGMLDNVNVKSRDFTGVGFFTEFKKPIKFKNYTTDKDINGNIRVLLNNSIDAGCLLFFNQSLCTGIEGYVYGDEWPKKITSIKILD